MTAIFGGVPNNLQIMFLSGKRHSIPNLMGHNERSTKRKIHSTKCPHKDTGEIAPTLAT